MTLFADFIRLHPWQTLLLSLAVLIAGAADGVGLSAMLPALDLAFDAHAGGNALTRQVYELLHALRLEPSLEILLALILLGISMKSLMIFVAEQQVGYMAAELATNLRLKLLRALTACEWPYYVEQSTGQLTNSMATEAWRASNAYVYAVQLFAVIIEMAVYTGIALAVSWRATLICLAISLVILRASHGLVRLSERAGAGQTERYRRLLRTLTDLLQSAKSFKAMGRERLAGVVLARESGKLQRHLRREVLGSAGLSAAQESLYTLVIGAAIYVAIVHLAMDLATVTFLALVLAKVLKQVGKVQKQYQLLTTCASAARALDQTIREAEHSAERNSGERSPTLSQAVTLNSVTLSYAGRPVLDQVSLEIPAGALTCLIGESGTGKTSIADLVTGLIRPDAGTVRVDEVPLAELDLQAWRRQIGYVPQDSLLLHDTVLRNVTLGAERLGETEATRALQAADAWTFVSALPERLHAMVGERGARLSGGQRQRIMLARALVHQPTLLILDEATSALDATAESAICETLAGLRSQLTILAISHRPALVAIADRVYRLDHGRVAQPDPARAAS